METLDRHIASRNTSATSPDAAPASTSTTTPTTARTRPAGFLAAPLIGSGVLMAAYLALRPYGDVHGGATAEAAQAFASWQWIAAHLCGALALASFGRFALRLSEQLPGRTARLARYSGLVGAVLVLPYYGAETFGLHALGRAAVAGDPGVLRLVAEVRDQPAALATFGAGLILLAVSGIAAAVAWSRERRSAAAWPLGVLVALVLPQFSLPPVGRVAFGVVYALAAFVLARDTLRSRR